MAGVVLDFAMDETAPDAELDEIRKGVSKRGNLWENFHYRADDFRLWLSTRCCTCLSFVPSLALVLIAAVLIMLLIATIPLAFALTYSSPQASNIDKKATENGGSASNIGKGDKFNFFVDREHSSWPELTEVFKYQDWEDHTPLRTTEFLPKNITSCTVYGFACTAQPYIVVSKNRRCDGHPDCEDGSDEIDCHECQTTLSCPASTINKNSKRRICLVGNHLCDEYKHCPGSEDETLYCNRKECSVDEYRCKDVDMCIPNNAICDGENHCPFGDDEQNCKECNGEAKMCGNAKERICLAKRYLCDGFVDCHIDASDEKDCDCASCSGKFSALCNGTSKMCISKDSVCNGRFDCPDGEDEIGCPGVCLLTKLSSMKNQEERNSNSVFCNDGIFHDWSHACDGLLETCRFKCKECNPARAFQCHSLQSIHGNGINVSDKMFPECIHRSLVCDGKPDCLDGSDELDCSCKTPGMNECHSKTAFRRCYSNSHKCDGYSDCLGGEDERNCTACTNGAFFCQTEGRCIPPNVRCNGEPDCLDESDEMNCTCKECSRHSKQMYMCETAQRCYPLNKVCTPYSVCANATRMDKMFCAIRGHEYF
uniref:Uncharacterized protein n=2 Tax=Meloidogyne TaxID=189290 RepID=A0A6V7TWG8_MELEN|nr:unnamed protein product [Meloidogyne enterolobii]